MGPLATVLFFVGILVIIVWSVARRGSWMLLNLLVVATVLAVMQNILGVALARAMNVSPYVGLLCGSVTLTGGPST